ncbi:amidase [Desulfonema ishimotonii]|uniref:Amidase n=1 Tax=Desulfonema ishimotonii TaxID=45657 RepID=A0A401FR59_9BACT|nr:amidase family protein [Desulfonema ishimotonii]GBC59445.1 amidase [Desulfonema ishimotonii]
MNQFDKTNISDPFVSKNTIEPYSPGELNGLSFAVKDNIDVANEITGYGSPGWINTHSEPVVNAICLEQLLNAGGKFQGKTKSDELAYSLIGVNSFYGTPLNPKAPDRVPGGSSSGSASAVASGLADFAIGTDTGGSIRVPASNCGVWGYRPSHGAISVSGVLALAPSFDTVGILAQTGKILEKVMQVLLAENSNGSNAFSSVCFVDDVFQMSDRQILDKITPSLNKISDICKVQTLKLAEITDPHVNCNWLFEQLGFLLSTEIWNTFGAWIKNEKPELSSGVEYNLHGYAESANRKVIQSSLCAKKAFQNKISNFLCGGKILCFPTTVDLAPRLDEITPDFLAGEYIPRAMGVNAISSLSCTPQITIPVAEANGVPVGLSFISGYGQDMSLISFCNQLNT